MKVNMALTELEWKLGLLNRYSNRYLLQQNIKISPAGANTAITGWSGKKKAVKYDVFMM